MEEHVGVGWVLARPWRPAWEWALDRLPSEIITVSRCLAVVGPGPWILPWVSERPKDSGAAAALHIRPDRKAEAGTWVDERHRHGEWGWTSWFSSADVAREFAARFVDIVDGPRLIGLGLPADLVDDYLEAHQQLDWSGQSGAIKFLERREALPADSQALGYEILGQEYSYFHSWYCNQMESVVHERLGLSVNSDGLLDDIVDARAAATVVNDPAVKGEPVTWWPFLLVELPLTA